VKTVWNFINGKKTEISALSGLALAWIQAKSWISDVDAVFAASALSLITGVAIGHRVMKSMSPLGK